LQDRYTVVLKHVQKRCLSGIVEAEEQELCVLVGEAERGQEVEDWMARSASCAFGGVAALTGYVELGNTYTWRWVSLRSFSCMRNTYQLTIHMFVCC